MQTTKGLEASGTMLWPVAGSWGCTQTGDGPEDKLMGSQVPSTRNFETSKKQAKKFVQDNQQTISESEASKNEHRCQCPKASCSAHDMTAVAKMTLEKMLELLRNKNMEE